MWRGDGNEKQEANKLGLKMEGGGVQCELAVGRRATTKVQSGMPARCWLKGNLEVLSTK